MKSHIYHSKFNRKLWIFKSVSESEKSYQTIENYNDDLSIAYNYDSKVANFKRIKVGDIIILANKQRVLGFATLEEIYQQESIKVITRCPTLNCRSTTIDTRKNLNPKYRCNNGHTFDNPDKEEVVITKYSARYPNTFIPTNKQLIDIKIFRPYYLSGYNRNMSMQLLDIEALKLFPAVFQKLNDGKKVEIALAPDSAVAESDNEELYFNLNNQDERQAIVKQIKARRGQKAFRDKLRKRYGEICMITNCKILDILEAAHIKPYRNADDNHASNGLLLRADIHTLYDLNLIGIEPKTLKIHISSQLENTEYKSLQNKILLTSTSKPNSACLEMRWDEFSNPNKKLK